MVVCLRIYGLQKVISYINTLNSKDVICVVSASYNSTNLLTNYCLEKDKNAIDKFFLFHDDICSELQVNSQKLDWLKENYKFIEQKFIERTYLLINLFHMVN